MLSTSKIVPVFIFFLSTWSLAATTNVSLSGTSSAFGVPNGCASGISYAYKIADDLWLCAPDAITGNNTFLQLATACNNAGNFYLATVGPMTARGVPTTAQWDSARNSAISAGAFDYVTTGQPTRSMAWSRSTTPYESTNGAGYISIGEATNGSNWLSLVDGNTAEYRAWPSANAMEVGGHRLISLCHNASSISGAYVWDYRWRK